MCWKSSSLRFVLGLILSLIQTWLFLESIKRLLDSSAAKCIVLWRMSRLPQAIPITIENIASKEFKVAVNLGDSTPGTNYEVGTTTPNPEQVIINGPESIINRLDAVVAQIDVTGMNVDGERNATLRLYDKNQTEISSSTIENELTFDGGRPEIKVYVDLWKKQTDVSFSIESSGTPADGYRVGTITSTPETVTVVGDEQALRTLAINNSRITIPGEAVSVEGASSDQSIEVDLTGLLPENMRLSSNMAETIVVNVAIVPEDSREIEFDVDRIQTNDLAAGLTVSYDQSAITLRVRGDEKELDALQDADITASISLSELDEGDYELPVTVKIEGEVHLVEEVTIPVHVVRTVEPDNAENTAG